MHSGVMTKAKMMNISDIKVIYITSLDTFSAQWCAGQGFVIVDNDKTAPKFKRLVLEKIGIGEDGVGTFRMTMEADEPTSEEKKKTEQKKKERGRGIYV